jgi:hypothetical protein
MSTNALESSPIQQLELQTILLRRFLVNKATMNQLIGGALVRFYSKCWLATHHFSLTIPLLHARRFFIGNKLWLFLQKLNSLHLQLIF